LTFGAPIADCEILVDSMVSTGVRYLDSGDIDKARQYLTAAHKCGMSLDSMHYFAAELFLAQGAVDTALIFNMVLERNGNINRSLYLKQRAKILRKVGLVRAADSLLALCSTSGRHDIEVFSSVTRSGLSINGLTIMPQHYSLKPADLDIDDGGSGGISYTWSTWSIPKIEKLSLHADVHGEFPVPTRNSYNKTYDTIMRGAGCGVQIGEFPKTTELSFAYKLRFHTLIDNVTHSARISSTSPVGQYGAVNGSQEFVLVKGGGLNSASSEISFSIIKKKKWYLVQCQ
jgi:hypothetical protein